MLDVYHKLSKNLIYLNLFNDYTIYEEFIIQYISFNCLLAISSYVHIIQFCDLTKVSLSSNEYYKK